MFSDPRLSESLSIGTSDLKNDPPHKMKLKQLVKEVTSILDDNDIETNIDCLGSHWKKKIIKIPSARTNTIWPVQIEF